MNKDIRKQLDVIATVMSKTNGLYHRWAQKRNVNYYVSHVFYALHIKDSITQRQICEMFEIPKQSVNNIVTSLKKQGYITLEPGESDKREKRIQLTQSGRKYADIILADIYALDEKVVARIGQDMFSQLLEAMTAYCDALEIELKIEDIVSKQRREASNILQ